MRFPPFPPTSMNCGTNFPVDSSSFSQQRSNLAWGWPQQWPMKKSGWNRVISTVLYLVNGWLMDGYSPKFLVISYVVKRYFLIGFDPSTYTIWLWLTVRWLENPWNKWRFSKRWENHLFLWAMASMAMFVTTRWYFMDCCWAFWVVNNSWFVKG